jgi:FkbM family methyltransferase
MRRLTTIGTAEFWRFTSKGTQVWLISEPRKRVGRGGIMNTVELSARWLKYQLGLKDTSGFVVWLRPYFNKSLEFLYGRNGLLRNLGGQESIRVRPAFRHLKDDIEPEVCRYMGSAVTAGDVVLELGANVGLLTILLARRAAPGGHVYAFEPSPDSLQALSDHLSLNGVSEGQATIVPAAVSDICGQAMFYFDGTSDKSTLSVKHERIPAATSVEVETVTIDAFCSRRKIAPRFIKIDIEGYELHALRGAELTLRRYRPTVLVEMHPMYWPEIGITATDVAECVSQLGYEALPLRPGGNPFTTYGHAILLPVTRA